MAQNSLEQWFRGMPPVTRWHFAAVVIVTLAGNFGLVQPLNLALLKDLVFGKFEIWRLATNMMFMGKLGFGFLIQLMFMYQFGQQVEIHVDNSEGPGEYFFFLLCTAIILNVIGLLTDMYFLGSSLIMSVIYYWSVTPRREEEVQFMFGLRFPGYYFPWVLLLFGVLMGSDPKPDLAGIVAAHVYHFLKHVCPEAYGHNRKFIWTPDFIKQLWNPNLRPATTPRTFGGGRRLGE